MLSPHDQAQARSYSYHLLGTVFLQGVHDGNITQLRALPVLADQLKAFPSDEVLSQELTAEGKELFDHAAADHQHWFGFNVFPFQSMFMSEECRVGGDQTRVILDHYQSASFPIATKGESPDHIGVMLYFLAFLCQREAQGWDQDNPAAVKAAQTTMVEFLDANLLAWLPSFVVTMRLTEHPFYSVLAEVLWSLTLEHRAELESVDSKVSSVPVGTNAANTLLEQEKTSLRDIATFCLTPLMSGWYISRDTIRKFSREKEAPAGFGARQLMLHNLFRSAVEYDGLPAVLDAMQDYADVWTAAYKALDDGGVASVKGSIASWMARIKATRGLLGTMKEMAFVFQEEAEVEGAE